jgi:hypothetical protein
MLVRMSEKLLSFPPPVRETEPIIGADCGLRQVWDAVRLVAPTHAALASRRLPQQSHCSLAGTIGAFARLRAIAEARIICTAVITPGPMRAAHCICE